MEASGKSTLVTALAARLRSQGADVVTTREPGGTPLGSRVRDLFLDPEITIDPVAEVLLVNASRAQLVASVVRPALAAGRWVLTDRFATATLAYQGAGRGVDAAPIAAAIRIATDGLEPDVVLLVDLPVDVSRARVRARSAATGVAIDRLERERDAFHERVRAGYLELARADARIRVLDGMLLPEALVEAAWRVLTRSP